MSKFLRSFLILCVIALLAVSCKRGGGGLMGKELQVSAPKPFEIVNETRLGRLAEGRGIPVGNRAPDFTAKDLEGKSVSLKDLLAQGPVLLVFYRGGWCPYCNFQIRDISRAYYNFRKFKVTPVAISVDETNGTAAVQKAYEIKFPVLSDPDLSAHEAFHMVNAPNPQELEKFKEYGINLEDWSGREHHKFAVPGVFLIDRDGIVRWAHADPDYTVRPSVEQLLAAVARWKEAETSQR